MKVRFLPPALSGALALMLSSTNAAMAPEAFARAQDGLVPALTFRQVSQTYGPLETTVSNLGVRMSIGSCIVTIPMPCDTMLCKNTRTRYYFSQPMSRFVAKTPSKVDKSIEDSKVVFVGTEKIIGLPVSHYKWVKWKKGHPNQTSIVYEFWVTRALPVPNKVCEVCNFCTYLPVNKGFPLLITGHRYGETVYFLKTESMRKVAVSKKFFESEHKNMDPVDSEMAVLLKERTTASEEDVSDLFKPAGIK